MATLKLTPKYFNTYEAAHNILSKNEWFQQKDWETWAKKGELDQYITVLANTDKIKDKQKFYKDYNYDYSDDRTRVASLYYEILADRTNTDTIRERYVKNEDGTYALDDKGKPVIEKYTASDYDYYKQIISDSNYVNYQKYLEQQEQERKDSMNGFVKFMGTVASIPGEVVYGLTNQLDNIFNSVAALGNGIDALFKGEDMMDAIVETNASDTWRLFENLGVQDWIVDFESRYTHMRDLNGNYSSFGKYAGGVSSTMGQMLPSMLGGKFAGKIASGAGATAKTVGTIQKVTSTLIFYQGMTAGNVRDMYQDMAKNGVSVPSGAILANASIKSALQWGVEVGLAKIFGGTAMDNMVFGRAVSTTTSKTLAKAGAKRLLGDFVQEGMEEMFQETSDFLVDRAFSVLIDENFGNITSLNWQSLCDAFVIGGIASFAGGALSVAPGNRGVLWTKRIQTPNVKLDKDGNVVYNKKGEPVFQKLGKLASWEYGLDMQSFMQNFAILQEQGKGLIKQYDTSKSKDAEKYAAAFTEMYAAYRMLSSIYNDIGDERFKAANELLTQITSMINNGKFDSIHLKQVSSEMLETLQGMEKDALSIAKDKLIKSGITRIAQAVERGEDLSDLDLSESTKKELEDLFAGDENVEKIILTEDGNNIVVEGGLMFVPIKYANKTNAETIYETVAEQTLVEKIIAGRYRGVPLQTVLDTFKKVSGNENATMEEAVYNLVFNDSFFRIILSTANKDTFEFVSSLIQIEESVVSKKLRDAIYKQKIHNVIEQMKTALYDYLVNQPFADYKLDIFTKEEQRRIAAARWCKNLYSRVINNSSFKKLSDNDWKVLENRVNSLPVKQSEKDVILKNLRSENSEVRTSAMNRIATAYAGVFTSKYDGKIYMPDTSIPNRTFNAYLQNNGLTVDTLINMDVDKSLKDTIVELYGEFNQENLIKFRQTQFMQTCNNKYTFRYSKQGKLGIYEATSNKQVGFSVYNEQSASLLTPSNLDKRTTVDRGSKKNYLVKEIISSEVDEATAAYLSIDNVITDPSLLSEQMQANIQLKYGEVNIETTFLYLRQHFLDKLKNVTVIVLADGSYAFGDVRPMLSSLKSKDFKIDKNTRITQLIKPAYLYGRLTDIKIRLTDRSIVAEYSSAENTIYINNEIAKKGGDLLTFAFLHEFQHAIQTENSMNIGMNSNWIKLKSLAKTTKQNIINDVRKHRPELFKDVSKGSETELQIVNDFVYFSSGESTALGADASQLVDFYPTIVSNDKNGTKIRFPWGTSYNLTNKLPMSLVSQLGKFDIEFTKQEKEKYKQLSQEAYVEISGKTDNKNVLTMFSSQHGAEFISTFLKILSVSDDMAFISNLYDYLDDNLQENYDLELQECYNLTSERIAELRLFARGIQDVDKVTGIKTLTVSELSELFFKYNTDISMEPIAKKVFSLMEGISATYGSNIAVSSWAEEALQFADLDNTLYVSGYCYKNLIRYCANNINVYGRRSVSEIYLHEAIHFVTEPLLNGKTIRNLIPSTGDKFLSDDMSLALNYINMLYEKIKPEYKFKPYIHLVENIAEFMSAITDKSFMLSIERKFTENIPASLQTSIFNLTGKNVVSYTDAYYELINYIVSQPASPYTYDAFYNNLDRNVYYQQLIYADTHDSYESLSSDEKGVYRTENGKRIYLGDVNFYASTSLGPADIQSMASRDVSGEERVKIYVESKAENFLSEDNKLTEKKLIEKLTEEFPYVPTEVISTIAKDVISSHKPSKKQKVSKTDVTVAKSDEKIDEELEALDESLEGQVEPTKVKKKGEKTPTKKRYVSQKKSTGTNLEKFGYTGKYKKTQLSPELQSFIVNATEDIDSELWNKVKSGKLTTQDVMDFFRDSEKIDDKTFKLINNSFFHNDKIKTFEQLKDFIVNKTPKYYAMRAVAKSLGLGNVMLSNTNPELLDKFLQIIEKDSKLKKLYDDIVSRYYTYKGNSLDISEKNLRRLWMQYFDGSAQTAGYLAAVAKAGAINNWLITGEGSTRVSKSLQDLVAEDMQMEEVIRDVSAEDAFEYLWYNLSREDKIEQILKLEAPKFMKKMLEKGVSERKVKEKLKSITTNLYTMSDKEFKVQYKKIVGNLTEEQINKIFANQLLAEVSGIDVNKLNDKQMDKLDKASEVVFDGIARPANAIVNNIRSIVRTIKSNLSTKDMSRFLKENSDIFTDKLDIKPELLRQKDSKGLERYVDVDKLIPLEDRVRQLSKDVRAKLYQSTRALNFKKQMDKKLEQLERENAKLVEQIATGKSTQAVTYEISDETITIDTTKEIPSALKRILASEFNKVVKSKTQYLLKGDEVHIQMNLKKFIQDNSELLQALTQSDVDEIIDFYLNSEILPSTNKARQYSAIQVYIMTYLIKGNKVGQFTLTEEQAKSLNDRLENIVSLSAANLSNWKAAMKMLKPAELIVQSLARSCDIEFSVGDVENLITAVESGDMNKIENARRKMYDNGLKQYNGRKTTFLEKLIRFERMAMLSGPGTMIRNQVSNVMVRGGNLAGEKIGKIASSLIEKMFPKKKWKRDKQYVIVGTKVSSEVQTFIQRNIIESGLLELVRDGINKYDVRKAKSDELTTEESLTELMVQSIKSKIFQENTFKSPLLNKAQQIVMKGLSDDRSINKAALRYFGKILVEDNVDLSQGLSTDVLNHFAEAYKLAAYDYMHKTNFFNKIEQQMKAEWGNGAFFVYKQLFPFASASWNWFVEGLNYTPVGLAKAIIQFARLENTIEKMDLKRQQGEQIISSRFAEYIARRNIGKGVIGSIGMGIGMLLAAFGVAGIDEEDDKYKLFINIGDSKVTIDISDVFGTQGIMLGITLISASKDGNWMAAIGDTFDTMFNDSLFSDLFNTFRYTDSFGDWLVSQPFSFLNMFIPNFVKTISSVANKYKIKYSSGILGQFERLAVNAVPGLAYAFPKQMDPYTGENQVAYKMWFVTGLANKLLPFKIYPYNVSDAEKEAIALGVKKGPLTGRYEINDEKVTLNSKQIEQLNEYYGKLNKKDLDRLMSNKDSYKVWDENKQRYVEVKYNKMSDKQKKTVIERIMSDNGQIAKVYILTSSGNWKYYTTESEYNELKKLGIKNVYKKTDKLEGFIAN